MKLAEEQFRFKYKYGGLLDETLKALTIGDQNGNTWAYENLIDIMQDYYKQTPEHWRQEYEESNPPTPAGGLKQGDVVLFQKADDDSDDYDRPLSGTRGVVISSHNPKMLVVEFDGRHNRLSEKWDMPPNNLRFQFRPSPPAPK